MLLFPICKALGPLPKIAKKKSMDYSKFDIENPWTYMGLISQDSLFLPKNIFKLTERFCHHGVDILEITGGQTVFLT